MQIAKVVYREVVAVGTLREMFQNVSFPRTGPTVQFLNENQCMVVKYEKPFAKYSQRLEMVAPYYENGAVYGVRVVALTAQEVADQKEGALFDLKAKRDMLLVASDGKVAKDSTANKPAWEAYRKQLRDFPATIADARYPYAFPEAPQQ